MTLQPNSPEARDVAYLLHPYTKLKTHQKTGPVIMERGEGVYVWDNAGNKFLEGMAGLWSTALGFNEERLINAATEQMKVLPYYHQFAQKSHLPGIDLAERLIKMAPAEMSKVIFSNSGSEANDTAIKLIWYYNNARGRHHKKKIISRIQGYHGVTVATASLTGKPNNHQGFDLPIANILHTHNPHYYRSAHAGESEEDFATRMADELENMILAEGPETVAAFVAEPIQGAGGVIIPPATYWQKIQAVLKKYDVLLHVDEVICGFFRTGNTWGSETYGITPDILTCAKALSSSYLPISATMVSEDIFEAITQQSDDLGGLGHGYTYTGHPVCAAVALETLKIYDERDILGHVQKVAPLFNARVAALADHPLAGEACSKGLIGAIEVVADKATKQAFDPSLGVGAMIGTICHSHGLVLRPLGDRVAMCPPLIIRDNEVNELFDKLTLAMDQVLERLTEDGVKVA
ncbi:MAG: aspartate aminotransferase family protein [Rhodospirillaceae bacterium]